MNDMEKEVTISLYRYDSLKYTEYEHKNLTEDLREVIKSIETLNWSKEELGINEKIIPVLKRYLPNTYKEQLKKIKELQEKENVK